MVLEPVNPTRAFLTVDSGFPLARLEQDLRTNRRFEYPFAPTTIPVLYGPNYWISSVSTKAGHSDFLDAFLSDPATCRLYLGLSKLDDGTAEALRRKMSYPELRAYAPVLDFFGSMFEVQNGVAFAPGGDNPAVAREWSNLANAHPSQGAVFYEKLVQADDGWLATYFDSLARLDGPSAKYLLQPERMKRFYGALRGRVSTPGPARPVFRASTDLMLLTTSLRIDANGQAHIPGGVDIWKTLFVKHPHGKYDAKLTKAASSWKQPDDLLEALFALSRKAAENEPLRIFLAVNDVDRDRREPLSASTAARLIAAYKSAGAQRSFD